MTGYVADLSWKSGARAIEKLDRLRSTMAVNVLKVVFYKNNWHLYTSLLLPQIRLLKVLAWHGKSLTVCGILMTYAL